VSIIPPKAPQRKPTCHIPDPDIDGIDGPDEPPYPAWECAADRFRMKHGLDRRPQSLSRDEKRDVLQWLGDMATTCGRDPQFAQAVRPLVRAILGEQVA
jgi:hypothetical protein